MSQIPVAVVDDHEIFQRGVVACLSDEPLLEVVFSGASGPVGVEAEVAVVSHQAALEERLACPLVVCSRDARQWPRAYDDVLVMGVLPRTTLSAEQLVATVRAAAAGLRVRADHVTPVLGTLDDRSLEVLRQLSGGADTHQIAQALSYSDRTVKALISDIVRQLGARNRAHAVAEGIRGGLI